MKRYASSCARTAGLVAIAGVFLSGAVMVAAPKEDQAKERVQKLQAELRSIEQRLGQIRADVERAPAIFEARRAADQAWRHSEKSRKDAEEARRVLGQAEMSYGRGVRQQLAADAEAGPLLSQSKELEAKAKAAEKERQLRLKALEGDDEIVAARKAMMAAQDRAAKARTAYDKALRDKQASDPEARKIGEELGLRWRTLNEVRGKLDHIRSLIRIGQEALDAERAYVKAVETEKRTFRAKLIAPDEGKTLETVEKLGPQKDATERDVNDLRMQVEASAEMLAAKKEWTVATAAVHEAQKVEQAKRDAWFKKRSDMMAAAPGGADLLARQKDLRAKVDPARQRLGKFNQQANQDAEVLAARKAIVDRRADMERIRREYDRSLQQKMAEYEEAKKLLEAKERIQTELKELTGR